MFTNPYKWTLQTRNVWRRYKKKEEYIKNTVTGGPTDTAERSVAEHHIQTHTSNRYRLEICNVGYVNKDEKPQESWCFFVVLTNTAGVLRKPMAALVRRQFVSDASVRLQFIGSVIAVGRYFCRFRRLQAVCDHALECYTSSWVISAGSFFLPVHT